MFDEVPFGEMTPEQAADLRARIVRWLARRRGIPVTPAEVVAAADAPLATALERYRRISPVGFELILQELRTMRDTR